MVVKEHEIFKALSEQIRLRIVILLILGELCVCDLMAVLNLPQSTISRHIARLKSVGLVFDRRQGKWVYYSLLDPDKFITENLYNLLIKLKNKTPFSDDISKLTEHLKKKKQPIK